MSVSDAPSLTPMVDLRGVAFEIGDSVLYSWSSHNGHQISRILTTVRGFSPCYVIVDNRKLAHSEGVMKVRPGSLLIVFDPPIERTPSASYQ